jgi:hypothetical protein
MGALSRVDTFYDARCIYRIGKGIPSQLNTTLAVSPFLLLDIAKSKWFCHF